MEETPGDVARKEAAKQAVALVFMVIALILMAAAADRDFVKTWRMRLAAESRKLLTQLARKAGHISMGTELRTGTQEYWIPLLLSRARDKAAQAYDRSREH